MCVLAVSFLEADRILRGAFVTLSRTSPVQPTLDLRQLAQTAMKDKPSDEKVSKTSRKDESLPDWSLMNVKRHKEKEIQKSLKIPDWSAEEERRFKLDTELKEAPTFQRNKNDDAITTTNGTGNNDATSIIVTKSKKNAKRQNSSSDVTVENIFTAENATTDMQVVTEKKFVPSLSTKSSPTTSRKGKGSSNATSMKENSKVIENESQMETGYVNNARESKAESKKKQANGTAGSHNNHNSYKKYETSTSQKAVQFSEEETSSTTTESSLHDDTTPYKVRKFTICKKSVLQS